MNRSVRTPIFAAGLLVCLTAAGAFAQSEKASVRMTPQPGQSVRMTMTQEMDFDLSFEGAAPPGAGSMKMLMRMTLAVTQKTGPRKADGTVDAEVSYDELRTEISMNGQAMPTEASDRLVGTIVTMTYGRNGEIVSVGGLPPGGLTDDAFRQMMGSLLGNLPMTELSVGEMATVPLDFGLPFPLPGAGPMKMSGETRIKLVSIDKDAQGRSARFDSTVNGRMASAMPSPDGKSKMTFDFTIGDGTVVIDLDKGLPRSAASTSTVNGTMAIPVGAAPDAALQAMTMRGTFKMTMTGQ